MKLATRPGNPIERMVLALGMVPEPLIHTQIAFTMARTIMAGVELGIFEALADGALTADDMAQKQGLHPRGTEVLMDALVGCDYLRVRNGRYELRPMARRWLLSSSDRAIDNKLRLQKIEWEVMGKLEDFVRTGEPMDWHGDMMDEEEWGHYQRGMADIGKLALPEVVRRMPIPRDARTMLDIGGAGGTYSAAFVESRPGLESIVLELPQAIDHARPLIESHGLGKRLTLEAGNVLEHDLGSDRFNFVFMANVAHHLSGDDNATVAAKVHDALAPNGVFCILDVERASPMTSGNQLGGLMNLYFALTSEVGTWSAEQMNGWLRTARFTVGKPIRLRTAPGAVVCWGKKIA